MFFVRNSRKLISVFGLVLAFILNSCATAPKLNNPKRSKASLETQTNAAISSAHTSSIQQIRKRLVRFQKVLNQGKLTKSDWNLHDELLDDYITLSETSSNRLTIPAHTRITLTFETYCLNAGRAPPSEREVYHWQKSSPGIKYYAELLALRRNGKVKQSDLQEILWNLGNETRWEDYPGRLKAILLKVDPRVAGKLPSRLKDKAKDIVADAVLGVSGASELLDTYRFIEGEYYTYEEFKESVEGLTSKHDLSDYDDLTQIPGTDIYSQSKSESFSRQYITFYNSTNMAQTLDLEDYYLVSERQDIQRIGINPFVEDPTLLVDLEKALYETMARLRIGFTPVLGDVAELYEVIYGNDFLSGKRLSFDERLASGVGVVLGSGSAYRHAKRWIHAPTEYLSKFESELARVTKKASVGPNYANAERVLEHSRVEARGLGSSLDYKGTQELSHFLKDSEIERKFRVQTVQSFEPGSIKRRIVGHDEIVYRWHNEDEEVRQFGRFVSPDKIENKFLARTKLALSDENRIRHLDSFTLKKGNVIFEGLIAPYAGQPGGGRQILIPGNVQSTLKFNDRIK